MKLTEAALNKAEPQGKSYRLQDSGGLFAEVRPTGGISFRMRYWYHGRDTVVTLGKYPEIRLREARDKRDEIRRMLANDVDPQALARYEATAELRRPHTFSEIAAEWLEKKVAESSSGKQRYILGMRLDRYVLPRVGHLPCDEITAPLILASIIEPIEAEGHLATAHRVLSLVGQVFRYAIIKGRATRDPTRDLQGALQREQPTHYASITDKAQFGALLRNIYAYEGSIVVRNALKLLSLTFVRPGELRQAEWCEFDMSSATWKIPATKMKTKRSDHIVPLSAQAVDIMRDMQVFTGRGRYVFPSARAANGARAISNMALLSALRNLGYEAGSMTAHGFRHSASTFLNESGLWSPDAIEKQLAHEGVDAIRATYNYAKYLDERRRMMQWWADWCDEVRSDGAYNEPSVRNKRE